MRRRFGSETRAGRIGDALLDLLYATPFVLGGLLMGLMTYVAVAEGADDEGALPGFGLAALLIVPGIYFIGRAIRGR